MNRGPRLAVRAIIRRDDRVLIVNAWPGQQSDLWCAPGGGVERGQSLPDNLARELREETGLEVTVGGPCLVNEFHDPARGFHQVELFFHATITDSDVVDSSRDPEGIVNRHRWVTRDELLRLRFKPDSLPDIAFGPRQAAAYDPLETIVP